jgi:hypothetical protein
VPVISCIQYYLFHILISQLNVYESTSQIQPRSGPPPGEFSDAKFERPETGRLPEVVPGDKSPGISPRG